jgi:hypothetical protein
MTAEGLNVGRRAVSLVSTIMLLTSACTSEDVGDQSKSGTGATPGVGSNAAGGASSVDTSGTRVNPGPTGSVVAPGRADSAAKTKGNRP